MFKAKVLLIPIGLLLLCLWGLSKCAPKPPVEVSKYALGNKEKEAVIVNTRTGEVTVIKKKAIGGDRIRSTELRGSLNESPDTTDVSVERTGGAREVRISVDSGGEVTVTQKTKGFCLDIGAVIGVSDEARGGIDVQWLYWRWWGLSTGATVTFHGEKPSVYMAGDYKLHWGFLHNTSVVVGYDTRKNIFVGMKLNF